MAVMWTEDLSTGVSLIDEQHKELFKRVNDLLLACSKGKGREEAVKAIDFLGEYIVMHFGAEEKYMRENDFPGYQAHKKQHDGFVAEFKEIKQRMEQNGPTVDLVVKINHFLIDWLINHIKKTDKALGAFLKNKI
ncbi:bacteriohemerythrin [Thermosediminibacter oceani]|uniref:Hemerythrin-like metal-binding protein n=1 Tax=Thermosediminibacter oceani (strain ATCC BAA-1034 / DSM 16646 / JW/IW-1228P) TaxID=555079 RepID=D9S1H1_THEOJ|nr:bacteriohemerythrin [Thermosediminibacter oceani]ADL07248.1 hemerythrin-like metal-binding protein [Thermosediminibacter oceani DSM 16646]